MDDAQSLFREGVLALRERKDVAEAQRLLTQSLRLDSQNDMAWLWLSQTIRDPQKRLKCVESALKINPQNERALALRKKFRSQLTANPAVVTSLAEEDSPDTTESQSASVAAPVERKLSLHDQQRIRELLKKGDIYAAGDDPEKAIEQWVGVLQIQSDHEEALKQAIATLFRLKYVDDARELVQRAIDSGTVKTSIYQTAIDLAQYQRDEGAVNALYEQMARLPNASGQVIGRAVDYFIEAEQMMMAETLLKDAIKIHPDDPILLKQMGDLHTAMENFEEATRYYDRVARAARGTKAGKEAEKILSDAAPVLTDGERGSVILAWREAAGFLIFFIALGWQDAGLNLMNMGLSRWVGVVLSLIGGYLVVTATSSPQQNPIATWLGGKLPEDDEVFEMGAANGVLREPTALPIISREIRIALGVMGAILLILAFWLVFNTAIHLLFNPVPPSDLPTINDIFPPEFFGG